MTAIIPLILILLSLPYLIISLAARKINYKNAFYPPVSMVSWFWKDGNIANRKIRNFLKAKENYPGKSEVVIIDNNSKDEAYEICKNYLKKRAIACYRSPKEFDRKAFALDKGIKRVAKHPILALTDPDGLGEKGWLKRIVQPFKDEKVGVVIGLTHCGNFHKNLFTRLRAVEDEWFYVISSLASENGVSLVIGSNYAIRRKALRSVGYHGKKTLAEDAELTIKMLDKGWKIKVVDAGVWQEEVEGFGAYLRQRLRWYGSGIESVWH